MNKISISQLSHPTDDESIKEFMILLARRFKAHGTMIEFNRDWISSLPNDIRVLLRHFYEEGYLLVPDEDVDSMELSRTLESYNDPFWSEPEINTIYDEEMFDLDRFIFDSFYHVNVSLLDDLSNGVNISSQLHQDETGWALVNILSEFSALLLLHKSNYNLKFTLDGLVGGTNYHYSELVYLVRNIPWLSNVIVELPAREALADDVYLQLEYEQASKKGTLRDYFSAKERLKVFSDLGIRKGSIIAMYKRSNPDLVLKDGHSKIGKIKGVSLIEIVSINTNTVVVKSLGALSSKAEFRLAFNSISSNLQSRFIDLANKKMTVFTENIPVLSISIEQNMCFSDDVIFSRLNTKEVVKKPMYTSPNKIEEVVLTAPQMVSAMLKEYGYSFDEEIFIDMYGKDSIVNLREGD